MGKLKIYLDTSVISYLDQQDAPERMIMTHEFWEDIKLGNYDVYISETVLKEIDNCTSRNKRNTLNNYLGEISYEELKVTKEIEKLSSKYIDNTLISKKHIYDATHIAVATINECDIIVSWNFKHMVKDVTIQKVNRINKENNYKEIEISPPNLI